MTTSAVLAVAVLTLCAVMLFAVWWRVRRDRRQHDDEDDAGGTA